MTALNYQTLGDLNFDYSEYTLAGSYYDSTLLHLKDNSKPYRTIKAQTRQLRGCHLLRVRFSERMTVFLRVVALSDTEKETYFQSYIEALKLADEASEKAAQCFRECFCGISKFRCPKIGKSFYFYNPTTVAFGKNEFTRIWGDRALEANWRLSSKTTPSKPESVVDTENSVAATTQDRFSVEYYLAQIPTDQTVLDSITKERNFAYYQLGLIYKNKFKDYKRAQNKLEKLLTLSPEKRLVLPAKYNLFKLYALLDYKRLQAQVKKDIIDNYPDSHYATILVNPESALQNTENSPEARYNSLYAQFESGHYQDVINGCDLEIIRLDGDEIVPKLELLKVSSKARLFGFEAYKEGLNFVALNYPSSIEGKKAAQMYETVIPALESQEFVQDSTQTNFKLIFKFKAVETEESIALEEALKAAIEDVDYFNYNVSRDHYDTNTIFVVVHGLKSVQGGSGFVEILENKGALEISKPFFGISSKNYQTVQIHKNVEAYLETIN